MTSRKLNLGCGRFPKPGYLNVDVVANAGVDLVHDLEQRPWPLPDGAFDVVEADHVLEHVNDVFASMAEIHRVLAPRGELILRVPHHSRGFTHPDHKRGFDATFPYYFDPEFPGGYCGVHFETKNVSMKWFAQPYLKKSVLPAPLVVVGAGVGRAIDTLANLSPLICSRLWANYVGGFEEISFVMEKR